MWHMHPCPAPTSWWQAQVSVGAYSVCVCVCVCVCVFSPCYVALWDSKTPHIHSCEWISYCVETSPSSWLPPQGRSLPRNLLSLFLSFIFCPTSFWIHWAAFMGVWCPLPAFRSCFVEVAQDSNDLLMNLLGRKWSPYPIPPLSWDCLLSTLILNKCFFGMKQKSN